MRSRQFALPVPAASTAGTATATSSSETVTDAGLEAFATDDGSLDGELVRKMLGAIACIKAERKRPTIERIISKMRNHHNIDRDVVVHQLELAVRHGKVIRLLGHNGTSSYADPNRIDSCDDLTQIVVNSVRELNCVDGVNLRNLEAYIRRTYDVRFSSKSVDLRCLLRASAKSACLQGLLTNVSLNTYALGPHATDARASGSCSRSISGVCRNNVSSPSSSRRILARKVSIFHCY
ncbi:unnamed protein product [Soboliphyme baturini]|uniref:H15 domain-containing protein n=1 Tax=Soboliphyme baturini TaxID=241478 RepID=A0A183IHZ3_9BILA|nr:unnamed protein product [Soboliphyme baturini]